MEKLIIVYDSQNKIVEMPLYEFIKIQYDNGNPFNVCNVTEEEFDTMEKQVKYHILYELAPRLGDGQSYNPFRYMMSYNGNSPEIAITDYESEKGVYYLTDNSLTYEDNKEDIIRPSGVKVYTTKTYQEVLNHYMSNTKDLQNVRKEDLLYSIKDIEKQILELREKRYRLLGKEYEIEFTKK